MTILLKQLLQTNDNKINKMIIDNGKKITSQYLEINTKQSHQP